jgi:hypothetical protein
MDKDPIIRIYNASLPLLGKSKSREYVVTTIDLIIYDLEEAKEFSEDKFQQLLQEKAEWVEKAAEKALKDKKNQDVA